MDGTADFRRLSDEELATAKATVDPALSPLDWENVRSEMNRRKVRRREKLLPIMTRVVAWYLLLGSAIGLFALQKSASAANAVFFSLVTAVLLLWATAGALILTKKRPGYILGVVALAFQMPVIDVSGFAYHFRPFYGVVVGLIDAQIQLQLGTGTEVLFRPTGGPSMSFAMDLVAAYGMVTLLRFMRRANRAS